MCSFVAQRVLADGPALRPAYTCYGEVVPTEHRIDRLSGYPGGAATVGNRAGSQFQPDTFGEALLLLATAARQGRLDRDFLRDVGSSRGL